MNRRKFILGLGAGAVGSWIISSEISCKKNNVPVDFTIEITDPSFINMASTGGSIITNDIIIVNQGYNNFIALSAICTHEDCNIQFESALNDFRCPCHGSKFSLAGEVTQGPATRKLNNYQTEVNGNILHIFS